MALHVDVLDRATALATLQTDVDDLSQRALEGNVFAETLVFTPALQFIDSDEPLCILSIRDNANRLMGLVPCTVGRVRAGIPLRVLRTWQHRYCFLGTPLLDALMARQVLGALAAWIASGRSPAAGIEWTGVSWDGPFGTLLRDTFTSSASWCTDTVVARRALLRRGAPPTGAISSKHAKDFRRLERRLATRGALRYEVLGVCQDWRPWLDEFIALEAKGWKGLAGSAINSKAQDRAFFREVVGRADARGQLQMLALRVDGIAIAMKLNLRSSAESYCLKIAHDESYAEYSPGVLLELFNIRAFAAEPAAIVSMDSCADPDHSMIDRLWTDRREIAFVTAARRGTPLGAFVGLRPGLRSARRWLTGWRSRLT